jgi:hypothetical protein
MLYKPFDQITAADLQSLEDNAAGEGGTIALNKLCVRSVQSLLPARWRLVHRGVRWRV